MLFWDTVRHWFIFRAAQIPGGPQSWPLAASSSQLNCLVNPINVVMCAVTGPVIRVFVSLCWEKGKSHRRRELTALPALPPPHLTRNRHVVPISETQINNFAYFFYCILTKHRVLNPIHTVFLLYWEIMLCSVVLPEHLTHSVVFCCTNIRNFGGC